MPKVLVVAQIIRPGGGPGGYALNMESGLKGLSPHELGGFDFEFAGQRGGRTPQNEAGAKFQRMTALRNITEITGLRGPLLIARFYLSKKYRGLKKAIIRSDIIIFHGPFFLDLLRYANSIGKTTIYMPHSPKIYADEYKDIVESNGVSLPERSYKIRYRYEDSCLRECHHAIFPSPNAAQVYFEKFEMPDKRKIRYIASGVDIDTATDAQDIGRKASSSPMVLYAGRYVEHKGFDDFCAAAEMLTLEGVAARFVCAGAGSLRANGYVNDFGWRSDIHHLVQQCQIVAIPNKVAYYDLFPLECAAIGKPLVMSSVGGNLDQAAELPDTIVYDVAGPTGLAMAIKNGLQEFKKNPQWGEENAVKHASTFTSKAMAMRWVSTLKSI